MDAQSSIPSLTDTSEAGAARSVHNVYTDPRYGFTSNVRVLAQRSGQSQAIVKKYLAGSEDAQRFRRVPPCYRHLQSNYSITGPPNSFQADLIFYPAYKKSNGGYNTALTAVDINTRRGYVIPINGKQHREIKRAFDILLEMDNVSYLTTDNGSEFISKEMNAYFKRHGIEHSTAEVGNHRAMGKIERFNGTIKLLIDKYMETSGTTDWSVVLPSLVENYNTRHAAIGMSPSEATAKQGIEEKIIAAARGHNLSVRVQNDTRLPIGATVRTAVKKKIFDKQGALWSRSIYTIAEHDGYGYRVKNANGLVLKNKWYASQLLSIQNVSALAHHLEPEEAACQLTAHTQRRAHRINRKITQEGISRDNIMSQPRRRKGLKNVLRSALLN